MSDSNTHVPRHVAIIPDGNRRWAKAKGLQPWKGHEEGAKVTEKLIEKAFDLGIKTLTFWGSSQDNLKKRPIEEKRALLSLYEAYFKRLLENQDIHKNETKIHVSGKWMEQFPDRLKTLIEECIEQTKNYSKCHLNFLLAYNGDEEMLDAVRSLVQSGVAAADITVDRLKQALYTHDLPEVDYLIRTGGEPHNSAGFMMWDVRNAQFFFSDLNFPDFGLDRFSEAIEEYTRRIRRLGA